MMLPPVAYRLVLLGAACLSVYLCHKWGWVFTMDFSMISTGTVFPLTFTLAQAFTRRERATSLIANLKASVVGLYLMHRDWDQTQNYPASLGNDEMPGPMAAKTILMELLVSIRKFLHTHGPFESLAEARLTAARHEFLSLFQHEIHLSEKSRLFKRTVQTLVKSDPSQAHLHDCYKWISRLSVLNEKLTIASGYTRGGEGGLSRTNQYLRYIVAGLEELRSIKEYRTPTMMRHACGVLIHIFAIVLAPYYVHYCPPDRSSHCAPGYACACAYVLIVMLLFHVQQDMENCFDETGLDDVFFTTAEELDEIGGAHMLPSMHSSMSDMSHFIHGSSPPRLTSLELPQTILGHDKQTLRTIPSDKALQDSLPSPTDLPDHRHVMNGNGNSKQGSDNGGWGRPASVHITIGNPTNCLGPCGINNGSGHNDMYTVSSVSSLAGDSPTRSDSVAESPRTSLQAKKSGSQHSHPPHRISSCSAVPQPLNRRPSENRLHAVRSSDVIAGTHV